MMFSEHKVDLNAVLACVVTRNVLLVLLLLNNIYYYFLFFSFFPSFGVLAFLVLFAFLCCVLTAQCLLHIY